MKTTTIFGAAAVSALLLLPPSVHADATATVDVTPQLQRSGLAIDNLRGVEIGGILVLRGRVDDPATAAKAGVYARDLGYASVANLIQVTTPPDDAVIERTAERKLGLQRSLDGCNLTVDSNHGIVTIMGKVNNELQKDVAMDIVRNIDGVRSVKTGFRD